MSEYLALGAVRCLRKMFDLITGYKHSPGRPSDRRRLIVEPPKGAKGVAGQSMQVKRMTENDWLLRFLFLETVAGVPGMVGGMIRHLRSLRRMEKEGRWIETLLEEAENERMHLMTFMTMKKPGILARLMIIGAQGVFCNAFFFTYLVYPPNLSVF
jgi:ubiquinol oxidase